jgi:mannose/cellobiose epimerase-like protein (N-acyl-D-glucosamine 2-epimerase family)
MLYRNADLMLFVLLAAAPAAAAEPPRVADRADIALTVL